MVTIQAPPDRLRHLRDLQRRRAERRKQDYPSPLALAAALDPATKSSPALRLIDDALVDLMADDSPHNALAVLVPAQEGKSTICSRRLPNGCCILTSQRRSRSSPTTPTSRSGGAGRSSATWPWPRAG